MNPLRLLFFTFCLLLLQSNVHAQKRLDEDSLWKVYNNPAAHDTDRLGAIHTLAWQLVFSDADSSIALANMELILAQQTKQTKYEANAHNTLGVAYVNKGDLKPSLEHHLQALAIRQKSQDKKREAISLNNIGTVYYQEGDYAKAIDYYQQSLRLKETIKDMAGVAAAYGNIGMIYNKEKQEEKALTYYLMGLHLRDSLHDQRGLEDSYINISVYYAEKKDYEKAREYAKKSLVISEALHHDKVRGDNITNIGMFFESAGELDSAEVYYRESLAISEKIGDQIGIANCYFLLGALENLRKNPSGATTLCLKSLQLADKLGYPDHQKSACDCLKDAYEAQGNYKEALNYLKRSILLHDSLNNLEKSKNIARKVMQYEFEKRALADSLRIAQENEVKDLQHTHEIRQQKTYTIAGVIAFLFMLIIAFVLLRGYRQKQKNNEALEIKNKIITEQKAEVENQKMLVEEKNKAVLDSITYAQRLQSAILPSDKSWQECFPESFIFHQPKDIVAGDFYWFEVSSEKILFAAADCTGHGVPGALVSVVCSNALNRAVKEFGLVDPGKILDKVTELVLETFEKSEREVSDGMDISLCCLDRKTNSLQWSGANNPLWIIFDGDNKISEWKADKQPVGQFDNRHAFTTHSILLQPHSTIYLFTDGFADQFGGPLGKKFKYKHFNETLVAISGKKMPEQKMILQKTFDDWKGNLEQVDDVCVIGIRI